MVRPLARVKFIPTAPVVLGLAAGSPIATLIIEALQESGVPIGPKTASLLGVLITSAVAYVTQRGRRRPMRPGGPPQRRSTD